MITYELRPEWLLCKWGFYDGDIFIEPVEEYYDDCEKLGIKPKGEMINRTLCEVVKKYLIPSIPFDVEYVERHTMHNPIRLTKIDGEEIKDHELIHGLFEGEKITVTYDQVRKVIDDIP